jgi:hypothetical protein
VSVSRFNGTFDPFRRLACDSRDNVAGREGDARGRHASAAARLRLSAARVRGHRFDPFNDVIALSPFEATALQAGGSIVAKFADSVGVYARGSYITNVGGAFREVVTGQFGVRVTW